MVYRRGEKEEVVRDRETKGPPNLAGSEKKEEQNKCLAPQIFLGTILKGSDIKMTILTNRHLLFKGLDLEKRALTRIHATNERNKKSHGGVG